MYCKVLPILVLMGPRLFLSVFIFPLRIIFYPGFDWLKVSKNFSFIFFFFSILLFPPDLVIIIDSINTVNSIIVIIICTIIIFTIDIAVVTIVAFIFFCSICYYYILRLLMLFCLVLIVGLMYNCSSWYYYFFVAGCEIFYFCMWFCAGDIIIFWLYIFFEWFIFPPCLFDLVKGMELLSSLLLGI